MLSLPEHFMLGGFMSRTVYEKRRHKVYRMSSMQTALSHCSERNTPSIRTKLNPSDVSGKLSIVLNHRRIQSIKLFQQEIFRMKKNMLISKTSRYRIEQKGCFFSSVSVKQFFSLYVFLQRVVPNRSYLKYLRAANTEIPCNM
jgi:hypothetical protein